MRLPNPKENMGDLDAQFLSDCFTSARDAGDDMQRCFNEGDLEKSYWWAQRATYWWLRVGEELLKLKEKS